MKWKSRLYLKKKVLRSAKELFFRLGTSPVRCNADIWGGVFKSWKWSSSPMQWVWWSGGTERRAAGETPLRAETPNCNGWWSAAKAGEEGLQPWAEWPRTSAYWWHDLVQFFMIFHPRKMFSPSVEPLVMTYAMDLSWEEMFNQFFPR